MQLKHAFSLIALAIASATATTAQAAPVNFSLSSTAGSDFTGNQIVYNNLDGSTTTLNAGAPTTAPNLPGVTLSTDATGTDVNFAAPTITSTATPGMAQFATFNYNYNVTLNVPTDPFTPVTFTVSGTISGFFSSGSANGQSVTAFSSNPALIIDPFFTYAVTTPSSGVVGTAPTPGNAGTLTLHISATPTVPEPASVALMGLGTVGLVGLVARRRRTA